VEGDSGTSAGTGTFTGESETQTQNAEKPASLEGEAGSGASSKPAEESRGE